MTRRFIAQKAFDTVHPAEGNKVYFQDGAYFDGDYQFVEELQDTNKRGSSKEGPLQVLNLAQEGDDARADYSSKPALHDPDPGLNIVETPAQIEARVIERLRSEGKLKDDGGDAKTENKTATAAKTASKTDDAGAKSAPAADFKDYDPKKGLIGWAKDELDPSPPFMTVRSWGTEALGKTYTTKQELLDAVVEAKLVASDQVKA